MRKGLSIVGNPSTMMCGWKPEAGRIFGFSMSMILSVILVRIHAVSNQSPAHEFHCYAINDFMDS